MYISNNTYLSIANAREHKSLIFSLAAVAKKYSLKDPTNRHSFPPLNN